VAPPAVLIEHESAIVLSRLLLRRRCPYGQVRARRRSWSRICPRHMRRRRGFRRHASIIIAAGPLIGHDPTPTPSDKELSAPSSMAATSAMMLVLMVTMTIATMTLSRASLPHRPR
jgi:hypothetical protein